jgi:hypothetical protein
MRLLERLDDHRMTDTSWQETSDLVNLATSSSWQFPSSYSLWPMCCYMGGADD